MSDNMDLWDMIRMMTSWCNSIYIFLNDDTCKKECHTFHFKTISAVLIPISPKIASVESSNSQKKLHNCHVNQFLSTLFTDWTLFHHKLAKKFNYSLQQNLVFTSVRWETEEIEGLKEKTSNIEVETRNQDLKWTKCKICRFRDPKKYSL